MMKKTWLVTAAVLAMTTAAFSTAALAADNEKVEVEGIAFEIPEELKDLVTVRTDDGDMLVSVYETASVKAAEALGEDREGAGWIFGISRMPEDRVNELRCDGMDGMEVFAEDDDTYLIYNHPTDVRFVREKQEEYEQGMDQWTKVNEWAGENVRSEILANNPEWEPEVFTNTMLDMSLARAVYGTGKTVEVRSLDFAGQAMPVTDAKDHLEDLADDFVYERVDDQESPAGEYIVLAFPEDDIRYEFPQADANYVREVRTMDGEDYETLYLASAKDADEDDTPLSIMQDWVKDILEGEDD